MRQLNNAAVEMLPIRLIMSIAMIAAILLLIVSASGTLRVFLDEQQVEQQCLSLQSTLSIMIADGAFRDVDDHTASEGTKRVHTFILPDSLIYLSFGGDPETHYSGVFNSRLVEDGAVIFYQVQGGSKKVIWLPRQTHKFREGTNVHGQWVLSGDGHSYIIRGGGTISLVFECVQKNHQRYILIHYNDGLNS
jgi:hypothetical protein